MNPTSIAFEKYLMIRKNYWTGARCSINEPVGRNWTTYYCFIRLTNNKCPLECIMLLINEYLNWIPAGCWNHGIEICILCGCGSWCNDIYTLPYCSYECKEQYERNRIVNEQSEILNLMDLFVKFSNEPSYIGILLHNFIENQYVSAYPLEWYSDYSESSLDDSYYDF